MIDDNKKDSNSEDNDTISDSEEQNMIENSNINSRQISTKIMSSNEFSLGPPLGRESHKTLNIKTHVVKNNDENNNKTIEENKETTSIGKIQVTQETTKVINTGILKMILQKTQIK